MKKSILAFLVIVVAVTICVPTLSLYNKSLDKVNSGSVVGEEGDPQSSFTLTYNGNGENVTGLPSNLQHLEQGQEVQLSTAIPKRPGYIFMGWTLSPVTGDITNTVSTIPTVTIGMDGLKTQPIGSTGKVEYVVYAGWMQAPPFACDVQHLFETTKAVEPGNSNGIDFIYNYYVVNNKAATSNLDSSGFNYGIPAMESIVDAGLLLPGECSFSVRTWGDKTSFAIYWTPTDLRSDNLMNAQVKVGDVVDIAKIMIDANGSGSYTYRIEYGSAPISSKVIKNASTGKTEGFFYMDLTKYKPL